MLAFKILQENITKLEVDLIVSPDDKRLSHSKGVSWQIAQAAGEGRVARFVRKYTPLTEGEGVLSDGFNLAASSILHLAIPQEGCVGFEQKLRDAYETLFRLVKEKECKSVALPLLGEGVVHMQKDHLMEIALCFIQEYLFENKNTDIFLCFSNRDVDRISYRLYEDLILYLDDYLITNVSLYDSLGSRIFIGEDRQHTPSTQASLEFLRTIEKRMEEKRFSVK
jgi:O-acetyl-ADP-ribose deacetylase (regulator of RNase III)